MKVSPSTLPKSIRVFDYLLSELKGGTTKTFYGTIAKEMPLSHHRPLNIFLGCIQQAILNLNHTQDLDIPLINQMVCNQKTKIPGDGCINRKIPDPRIYTFNYDKVAPLIKKEILALKVI